MKTAFVKTANVLNFTAAMARLSSRNDGVPGMALVYGEPGLGKTQATTHWVAQNANVVYVRAKALMTPRWLLEDLATELGEDAEYRSKKLFESCCKSLGNQRRMILVDEVDYLLKNPLLAETLRDLHDSSQAPIVLIGMAGADKKIARYRPLTDRLSEIVPFKELSATDVRLIVEQLCDVKLTPDACAALHARARRFRQVVMALYKIEHLARANSLKEVQAQHVEGLR